jgi:hypothetical protein
MDGDRTLTIHFTNGSKMEVSFPQQIKDSSAGILEGMKRVMEADKLAIEADGRLIVIPWSGVEHIELSPVPSTLPFGVVRGARIVRDGKV